MKGGEGTKVVVVSKDWRSSDREREKESEEREREGKERESF